MITTELSSTSTVFTQARNEAAPEQTMRNQLSCFLTAAWSWLILFVELGQPNTGLGGREFL